eukprot:CAMPEP_0114645910 /NCGR_PEP_ID=MMETSP0191-20121206/4850_1 /TAXON_ID=126664 /ORGANISM="Sorites sp." /LENGTH=48 /DNA_ID= /DNA_START= /DNA_END= /DNA_ORIENTATION=
MVDGKLEAPLGSFGETSPSTTEPTLLAEAALVQYNLAPSETKPAGVLT